MFEAEFVKNLSDEDLVRLFIDGIPEGRKMMSTEPDTQEGINTIASLMPTLLSPERCDLLAACAAALRQVAGGQQELARVLALLGYPCECDDARPPAL